MSLTVRQVDLPRERGALLKILQRNLDGLDHDRRFEWLYQKNPAGCAWSWFVFDETTERIVGIASVFPRSMWIGRDCRKCGQVGDFAVDAAYRSLGPAVMLQRATLGPVEDRRIAFCYDCPPNEAGMAPFRRLGLQPSCRTERYAKLLRADRWLARRLGGRQGFARPIAAVANLGLALWDWTRTTSPELEIAPHSGPFGEQFSALDERVGGTESTVRSRRRAEDLNWRYVEDPLNRYRTLTAHREGVLQGYIVYSIQEPCSRIVDLFGLLPPEAACALIESALEDLRKEGVETVDAIVSNGSETVGALRTARFRYRSPAVNVVAYARPDGEIGQFLEKAPRWQFSRSDIMS